MVPGQHRSTITPMKLHALPLLALSLLLGACSSAQSPKSATNPGTSPAVRTENKVTALGEFPSYDPQGQHFKLYTQRRAYEAVLEGRAMVDVIVNADGTVQDVAIFESSGDPSFDQMAIRLYKNSRYSLRLAPDDPAPYVVRQFFVTRQGAPRNTAGGSQLSGDINRKYSDITPMGQGAKHWTDK